MHRVNAGYTLLARIKADRVEAASALLAELDAHPERIPFASSPTTHFATITIIPAETFRGKPLPATLLFATSFCGPTRTHVSELVRIMGDALREVFAHCEGFVVDCSDRDLERFILAHRRGDTFYSGMQNLSPEDVRRHRELRDAIEAYIDERQETGGFTGSPSAVRREIQQYVKSRPDLAWAQQLHKPTARAWLAFHWRSLVVEAIVAALLLCTVAWIFVESATLTTIVKYGWIAVVACLLFLVVLVLSVRVAESKQAYVSARQPDDRARRLAASQQRPVINEFTIAGPIKEEGMLRPLFVRLSLWIVARVAEGIPGIRYLDLHLGINIPTVATARWISADGGRRMIFISNYTNDGEPYVRDFIETRAGAMRINLTFGFGRGYPKTQWVVLGGAITHPNEYLYALNEHHVPTAFWYGPHRDISIDNIKLNRKIREGLFAIYNEDQAQAWLHLL
jgi:hypothetical protein